MSTGLPRLGVKYSLCCELATQHYPSTSAFVRFSSTVCPLKPASTPNLHKKKLSGTFLVLIIKSVRQPSLWRECFWEKLFKTDETYTRAHHPLPPAFQASLTQSAPFSCPQSSIPTYFLTFPVLTTILLTV